MSRSFFPRSACLRAIVLVLAACRGDVGDKDTDKDTDTDTDVPLDVVQITALSANPTSPSQTTVSATFSESARAAAACVRRDDPTEVHLLEGEGASIDFRFTGLLSATDYDCSVAALDPSGPPAEVSFLALAPPFEHASAEATSADGEQMTGVYTVMNVKPECYEKTANYIAVLDPEGNNRWRYDLQNGMNIGIEVVLDGPNRFLWGGGRDRKGAPSVVDVTEGEVWRLEIPGGEDVLFHHDVARIADGRILSVEENDLPGWDASQLRLSDPETGETTWLWDITSAVDSGFLPPVDPGTDDPHHLNWAKVVETPRGLEAVASLCYAFNIIGVDVESSEPAWTFGYGGDFTLVDGDGNPLEEQEDFPQCQHGLSFDGTHLLIYDNAFNRPNETRAVEYALDFDTMTARKTWDWYDEGFSELYHGGADWLVEDHSRVLVTEGSHGCDDDTPRPSQIVELDRTSGTTEIHRLVLRDLAHHVYRAHRLDGCDVFANAKWCPTLATRLDELRGPLGL